MRDLLVAVPSRGRPDSIRRLRDVMQATCQGDTTLLVGVDDDDPALGGYLGVADVRYRVTSGLRGVVAVLNAITVPHLHRYRFVGCLGDDFVPRTPGWDVRIMEALGQAPMAFGNDLYPREPGTLPCHVFMRSEVIAALGFMGPPQFRHMFVDAAWQEWGKACGIAYLHDVVIEHLHFTNAKAPQDATYQQAFGFWPEDEAAWNAYRPGGLAADVAKIRTVL